MREYQHKHQIRSILYSKVTIVILFLFCILLLRSIVELNNKRIAVNTLRAESLAKRQDLEMKVNRASEKNDALGTPRGFESYVRTTYPVVKEGEGVIIIYDGKGSSTAEVKSDMTILEHIKVFLQGLFAKE